MSRFDEEINRYGTDSLKYDFAKEYGKPEDVIPLWVADMDFKVPEAVISAIKERTEHGIFGYTETGDAYNQKVMEWFKKRHDWEPKSNSLVKTPGVVFAICCAIRAFTKPGEAVLIQPPVYYPFKQSIENNERICVESELLNKEGHYEMDYADLEKKIVEKKVKLFILCSPHNPVGRVWRREELEKVAEICAKHNVFVIADEIHCDFTYPGHPHIVYAKVAEESGGHFMVATAPSKTFNLAGLQISNIFIPDKNDRLCFKKAIAATGYEESGTLGIAACVAAYEKGAQWLDELKEYLLGNLSLVREFLKKELPMVKLVEPEGTYVVWLDFSGLGLGEKELDQMIVEKAKLWLDNGKMFGKNSGQFQRINLTCTRKLLQRALEQLKDACNELENR